MRRNPQLATKCPSRTSLTIGIISGRVAMVKKRYRLGFLVAFGLGFALTASGQGRGFSAPMRGFSAPVRSAPARGLSAPIRTSPVRTGPPMRSPMGANPSRVRPSFVRPRGAGRGFVSPGEFAPGFCSGLEQCGNVFFPPQVITATPQEPNFGVVNGVPGLGFDFPHLAAINRGFNGQAGFVNAFNNGFFNNGFGFIPFLGSSPLYYPPYEEETPDYYTSGAQQPQFVIPRPQATAPPAETGPRVTEPQTPAPPPPELGQLILVRSDGQVLLAVAFTTNNGQLTYITREGTRRSFPLSELDKDATRQMNDANGTSVSLPE
jgi:hypothetical protein